MRLNLRSSAFVEYETFVLNRDGSVAARRRTKRNLIYDQGLNQVATNQWTSCFENCAVGTGTRAVKRDSGAVTFTRSGTAVAASAGFFEAADEGRLLKFDTGEEMYITAFTDAQNVTVNISGALAASEGTVWYVNDTGHQTESARTSTVSNAAGDNETTFSVDTYTHKRTFLFPAVGSNVTYREIGWSPSELAGANLFGRDVIPGAGDSLLAGQQYKVIVRLFVRISPISITAVGDVGNNGYVTAGDAQHEYILNAYSRVASNGGTLPGGLEPSTGSEMNIFSSSPTLLAAPSFTSFDQGGLIEKGMTLGAYSAGTFFRDSSASLTVSEANGSHYGFCFGDSGFGGSTVRSFSVKFTAAQTKDSDHTLTVTLRKSWGRALVN